MHILASLILLAAGLLQPSAPPPVERLPDGIRVRTAEGVVSLRLKSDSTIRVTFSKEPDFRADDMVVIGPADGRTPPFAWSAKPKEATLTTARLRVSVSRADGAVTFADASGHVILAEAPGGHKLTPADVQGEHTFHVQQLWMATDGESLY